MRSAKRLRDTAQKERDKATSLQKEADRHREKAKDITPQEDPDAYKIQMDTAQGFQEQADRHNATAQELELEASQRDQDATRFEGEKQELINQTQRRVAELDQKIKAVRGE